MNQNWYTTFEGSKTGAGKDVNATVRRSERWVSFDALDCGWF